MFDKSGYDYPRSDNQQQQLNGGLLIRKPGLLKSQKSIVDQKISGWSLK
jgi:hypothetical protein